MIILHSLHELSSSGGIFPPIGITIGNFDGVHIGHQKLLKKIKQDCIINNLDFVVVTFSPHPQKILQPSKERFLLISDKQKRNLLEKLGVDYLVEILFNRDFSTLSPEDFLRNHLFVYPSLRHFYLGYDFAFGANKEGGHDLVESICRPLGIKVEVQPKFELNGKIVSSSLIRDLLVSGKIDEVQDILGRPFHLEGVVIKGEGRGKKIGFPTANVQVSPDLIVPHKGVYITRTVYKGMTYESVTNIGSNPTFKDGNHLHIETNLFDFDIDIYGEVLEILFLHKIRDERKFTTVNELVEQIRRDITVAKDYLRQL
jgi:riboflavin kinase / FMN adenylyltransferase